MNILSKVIVRILVSTSVVVLILLAPFATEWTDKVQSADSESRLYQGRTRRTVGNRPNARTSTRIVPSKARTTIGGGGDSLGVCNDNYIFPSNTEVFGIFPDSGRIELNKPHVVDDLIIEACRRLEADYTFTLYAPNGAVVTRETGTYLTYNFPAGSVLGEYQLNIAGTFGTFDKSLSVAEYNGPRLELSDPTTGKDLSIRIGNWVEADRSNGINIDYFGFEPETTVEVGLYQKSGFSESIVGNQENTLVDSWLITTDAVGKFSEKIDFAMTTEGGSYILVACAVDDCLLGFSNLNIEPLGPPNGVLVPPMGWQEFAIGAVSPSMPDPHAYNFLCFAPCVTESATGVANVVPEKTERVPIQWEYENIPVGANYVRTWTVPGKGEWIRYQCLWPGPEAGIETIALREPAGLYSGIWQVTVSVNGEQILQEEIIVEGDWEYWDPAGTRVGQCR